MVNPQNTSKRLCPTPTPSASLETNRLSGIVPRRWQRVQMALVATGVLATMDGEAPRIWWVLVQFGLFCSVPGPSSKVLTNCFSCCFSRCGWKSRETAGGGKKGGGPALTRWQVGSNLSTSPCCDHLPKGIGVSGSATWPTVTFIENWSAVWSFSPACFFRSHFSCGHVVSGPSSLTFGLIYMWITA